MQKWQRVEITWIDADHGSGWQNTFEESRLPGAMVCVSLGYFLRETTNCIKLAQSHTSQGQPDEQVNGLLTIPKSAIKRKRLLKG